MGWVWTQSCIFGIDGTEGVVHYANTDDVGYFDAVWKPLLIIQTDG